MTAARHARPSPARARLRTAARVFLAAVFALVFVAGAALAWHSPGNAVPPPPRVTWATWNTPWFTERWPLTRRQP